MASLRRAVVVGIDEYENSDKIPGLKGALNDSKEMHERLTTSGKFTIDDKHFLTGEKATSENIRRAISDLLWRTDPCELSLLYFSGHGFQDGYGNGYIAPYDLKYEEPLVRGIRIQELKEYFLASKNKERALLVLDCCHSGIATEGSKDLAEVKLPFYQSLSSLQQDAAGRGSGKFILASSGAGEKSREVRLDHFIRTPGEKTHDHGLFTFHLLEGLNGKAADENNRVTLGRLHKHVSEQM